MSRNYLAPEIAEVALEPLTPEEFNRRLATPQAEEEVEETIDLIRWFLRRYPTPKERLTFARSLFEQWTRPAQIVPRRVP